MADEMVVGMHNKNSLVLCFVEQLKGPLVR